ncbi:MAG: 2-oxoacid:acceptor oxidoreductase family protein [Hyphomicrobiaceae bacterium]
MQSSLIESGVGGQGIQVSSKLIAAAATAAGLNSMHYALYSGRVRGGVCECSVVISDGAINSPLIFEQTDHAIIMHESAIIRDLHRKVRPGGLIVLNTSIVTIEQADRPDCEILDIPVTRMATDLGNVMAASMIAIGAYVARVGTFETQLLEDHLVELIPAYRAGLIDLNKRAIRAGADYARGRMLAGVR